MLRGRDPELARLTALIDGARAATGGVLVVRGEPGVGKTALLEGARERAGDDVAVLATTGVESESDLPFAAVQRLLLPALDRLARLPEPQAAALSGAFGLAAAGRAEERFLVYAACLSLLCELAEDGPVLCLVDDAQWLDAASADALRFVARRLGDEGVALVFGVRDGDVATFAAPDLPTLILGGLRDDAAAELLGDLPATVRAQLVAHTGGNALALLELPSALTDAQRAGREPLPEALPMTAEMERVFLQRARRLPGATQELLVLAAADDTGQLATVLAAAAARGLPAEALDDAERAGLLSVVARQVTFRHPLVRSAVYSAATTTERAAAHQALAAALAGDDDALDRRAWHLAAAAVEPDDAIVADLEAAARRAQDRGGHPAAARALERAAELTAAPAARGRRLVAAARAASLAGRTGHAAALAQRAEPLVDDPIAAAELARVRGVDALANGRAAEGQRLLLDAGLGVAGADPVKAVELLAEAAQATRDVGRPDVMILIGQAAARLLPALEDDEALAPLLRLMIGFGGVAQGDAAAAASLHEGLDWATRATDPRDVILASGGATWLGDFDRAALLIGRAAGLARTRGAMALLAQALGLRAPQLFLAQQFDEALVAASEAVRLSEDLDLPNHVPLPLSALANVAAVRGDEEATRRHADDVFARSAASGIATPPGAATQALGLLHLGHGRWTEAADTLETLADGTAPTSSLFLALMSAPYRIEAAVRAERPEAAADALAVFDGWAAYVDTPWARPLAAACRALVAEGDEATAHFEEAVATEVAARPFDRGRIRLLYGEHLRRCRRRVDARVQLRAAIDAFDRLDAAPWADRARSELRASGETARRRDPSTLGRLTPQELQVGRLVAQGLSNKQVAAQLFLSPRTVDAHLRRVFAKLDVTSRTQLALVPALAGSEPAPLPV